MHPLKLSRPTVGCPRSPIRIPALVFTGSSFLFCLDAFRCSCTVLSHAFCEPLYGRNKVLPDRSLSEEGIRSELSNSIWPVSLRVCRNGKNLYSRSSSFHNAGGRETISRHIQVHNDDIRVQFAGANPDALAEFTQSRNT